MQGSYNRATRVAFLLHIFQELMGFFFSFKVVFLKNS